MEGFHVCDNSSYAENVIAFLKSGKVMLYMSSGKAFEVNFQCFALLYGTCGACSLVLVYIFFVILGYR